VGEWSGVECGVGWSVEWVECGVGWSVKWGGV
jgi:hypothetical protein